MRQKRKHEHVFSKSRRAFWYIFIVVHPWEVCASERHYFLCKDDCEAHTCAPWLSSRATMRLHDTTGLLPLQRAAEAVKVRGLEAIQPVKKSRYYKSLYRTSSHCSLGLCHRGLAHIHRVSVLRVTTSSRRDAVKVAHDVFVHKSVAPREARGVVHART